MSPEQLKDFIDLYCNVPTHLCGIFISLILFYFIRRIQVVYDFKRHREYYLESCESSFMLSAILSFVWPISIVILVLVGLKHMIEYLVIFLVNRVTDS